MTAQSSLPGAMEQTRDKAQRPLPVREIARRLGAVVVETRTEPKTVPYARGSVTSAGAATRIRNHREGLRARVLETIRNAPEGLTDEQIADRTNLNPSTARPRRLELSRAGLIVKAGRRPTRSGRQATVWQAAR